MPLHDFRCPDCKTILPDQYRSITEGASARLPICVCGSAMAWVPKVGRMDALEPGQEFETTDGRGNKVLIDSLSKLRKVESESERMAANGDGQRMTWRMYSNDRSNKDVNTHGPDPSERPSAEAVKKFAPGIRRQMDAPDHAFGPGVNESNASALGMGE